MMDEANEYAYIDEEFRRLVIPLIGNLLDDSPLDVTLYCARYFNSLVQQRDKEANQQLPNVCWNSDLKDEESENPNFVLSKSLSMPSLTADSKPGTTPLRETSSWNDAATTQKTHRRRLDVVNVADAMSGIGDQQDKKQQSRESAVEEGKSQNPPAKEGESGRCGDETRDYFRPRDGDHRGPTDVDRREGDSLSLTAARHAEAAASARKRWSKEDSRGILKAKSPQSSRNSSDDSDYSTVEVREVESLKNHCERYLLDASFGFSPGASEPAGRPETDRRQADSAESKTAPSGDEMCSLTRSFIATLRRLEKEIKTTDALYKNRLLEVEELKKACLTSQRARKRQKIDFLEDDDENEDDARGTAGEIAAVVDRDVRVAERESRSEDVTDAAGNVRVGMWQEEDWRSRGQSDDLPDYFSSSVGHPKLIMGGCFDISSSHMFQPDRQANTAVRRDPQHANQNGAYFPSQHRGHPVGEGGDTGSHSPTQNSVGTDMDSMTTQVTDTFDDFSLEVTDADDTILDCFGYSTDFSVTRTPGPFYATLDFLDNASSSGGYSNRCSSESEFPRASELDTTNNADSSYAFEDSLTMDSRDITADSRMLSFGDSTMNCSVQSDQRTDAPESDNVTDSTRPSHAGQNGRSDFGSRRNMENGYSRHPAASGGRLRLDSTCTTEHSTSSYPGDITGNSSLMVFGDTTMDASAEFGFQETDLMESSQLSACIEDSAEDAEEMIDLAKSVELIDLEGGEGTFAENNSHPSSAAPTSACGCGNDHANLAKWRERANGSRYFESGQSDLPYVRFENPIDAPYHPAAALSSAPIGFPNQLPPEDHPARRSASDYSEEYFLLKPRKSKSTHVLTEDLQFERDAEHVPKTPADHLQHLQQQSNSAGRASSEESVSDDRADGDQVGKCSSDSAVVVPPKTGSEPGLESAGGDFAPSEASQAEEDRSRSNDDHDDGAQEEEEDAGVDDAGAAAPMLDPRRCYSQASVEDDDTVLNFACLSGSDTSEASSSDMSEDELSDQNTFAAQELEKETF